MNVHWAPVHLHSVYQEMLATKPGMCPVAEQAGEEILSVPLFPAMTDRDVDDVIAGFEKVLGAFASD